MKKRLLMIMLLILALTLGLASCGDDNEKKVTALTVIDGSISLEYTVGDTPDLSGIKAVISYSDGTAETVEADKLTVGTLDTSTAGTKELSVKYGDFETKVQITVKAAPAPVVLESIQIISGTVSTEIYIGDDLDTSRLQAEALYSDGSKKYVAASGLTVGQIDTSSVGDKTLTVSYTDGEITKTASVTVKVSGIASLTVVEGTLGKLYNVGDTIDLSTLEVIVTYQNGKSETVGASKLDITAPSTAEMGEKSIVIGYRGAETPYKIMVRGVTEITVNSGSVKTEVKIGTTLDVTGVTAKATYNNGDEMPLLNAQLSIQNIDTSTAGKKELIVKYGSVETKVEINVYGVKDITLTGGSIVSVIKVGETVVTGGASAIVTYGDAAETKETVNADALTFGTVDTSSVGEKELSVTYLDKTVSHKITVKDIVDIEIDADSIAKKVIVFGTLDTSGIRATAIYSNGDREPIAKDALTVGALSTDKAGTKTLTVTYGSYSDTVEIEVFGVSSIKIQPGTYKAEALVGEEYSAADVKVIVTLDDGSDPFVLGADALTISLPETDEAGKKSLSISYLDYTLDLVVTVYGIKSIEVDGVPQVVIVGDQLDLSEMKVYAIYGNKTEIEITEGYTTNVDELDFSVEGVKDLIVTYGDFTATVRISNEPPVLESVVIDKHTAVIGIGQAYDVSLVTAIAHYDNGSTKRLTAQDLVISALSTSEAGEKELTVSFTDHGKTMSDSATVNVLPIVSLQVSGLASKVELGEEYDVSRVQVLVTYSDGENELTELVGIEDGVTVTGYNTSIPDDQTVTVSFRGASERFTLHVKALASIEIVSGCPEKIKYAGAPDLSGLTVKVIYTDGTYVTALASEIGASVSVTSTEAVGSATVTVAYAENGIERTASSLIEILSITSVSVSGLPSVVDKGAAYDTGSVKVFVTYADGELTEEVSGGFSITDLDTSTSGDKTVRVTYLTAFCDVPVHVRGVKSISILAGSVATEVRYGYVIDTSGLIISVTYTNGDTAQFTKAQLGDALTVNAPSSSTDSASVTLTVTYEGASASASIAVLKIDRIHAVNGTIPSSVLKDSVIDYDSLRITVIYKDANNNFFTYLVGRSDPNLKITEISTATVGDKAIIFEFVGKTTSANVTVKGVTKIELVDGIQENLNVGQDFSTSDIKVKVEFSDGSYIYATTMDLNLVVDASGVDTSSAGDKVLKVHYLGFECDIIVKVHDVNTGDGMIFGIALPDNLVAREKYKLNYKLQNAPYVVGDDNLYYFYLSVVQLDSNDNLIELDGKNIKSAIKVYLVDGGETLLEGDALAAYVTVDAAKNSYDFTEAAIGKTFRLEIMPAENYVGTESRSHTVKIVDGYNVYNAKELHIMTNVDHDLDGGDIGVFNSSMTAINNFLAANGIVRPAKLAGLVIHQNLDITMDDVPSEFFHTYTKNGVTKTELLDRNHIFNREADNENPDFAIHGNYYSIYSYKIPCVVEKGVMNNDDEFSNSTLFKFDVKESLWTADFNHENYSTTVENLSFRDNDPNSNDQAASERHMRGVLCMRYSRQVFNIKNTNVEAYYVSTSVDYDNITVNFDSCKLYNSWQGHVFIWNDNQIQRHIGKGKEAPLAFHKNIKVNITNSLLAKCGGPVILSQNDYTDYACNDNSGVDVTADYKSEIYSYVTGQEAWFVAVNHTSTASDIKALDQLVAGTSAAMGTPAKYTSTDKIEGVSTINFMFMVMGTGTELGSTEKYKGTFTRINEDGSATVGLNMADPYVNGYIDGIKAAMGVEAPVFQSSVGAVFYANPYPPQQGCYSLDGTTPVYPMNGSFTGDYLGLYYLGMGVMLEYFN